MKASIVRLEHSLQGELGALLFDGVIFCFTLQPDSLDTLRFHIPEGNYIAKRFHGTKWPNTFEIVGEGTKGHSALLFHAGNTEVDSLGCTLLGSSVGKLKGYRAVSNSGLTFKLFLEFTKNVDSFPLKIIDCFTE
jgi:hypothetical protein